MAIASLGVGFLVALTVKEGTAPLRCYVGEVQSADEHGVRLTLADWIVDMASGWDFFAPWESITAALVATEAHHKGGFDDAASDFQTRCEDIGKRREAVEKFEEALG